MMIGSFAQNLGLQVVISIVGSLLDVEVTNIQPVQRFVRKITKIIQTVGQTWEEVFLVTMDIKMLASWEPYLLMEMRSAETIAFLPLAIVQKLRLR